MKDLKVTHIKKRFSGYGHNEITITITGLLRFEFDDDQQVEDYELKCTSNNVSATDAYFDDQYDENLENKGRLIETRYEAGEQLVNEVFRKHEIVNTYEITEVPTVDEVIELRKLIS